jgi:phosphonate transport system permease protein
VTLVNEKWRANHRADRLRRLGVGMLFVLSVAGAAHIGKVDLAAFVEGIPAIFDYIFRTLPHISPSRPVADLSDWYWNIGTWLSLLLDTILMAFLGTLFGTAIAFGLCFFAARNLSPHPAVAFLARRVLEIARTVPELVYALVFVFAFGLGPLPGVLALMLHSAGSLGKLFAEACENVSGKPLEGTRAAGGSWSQIMRFGVLPQVLPTLASYTLLRFEINIRSASVLGLVGAGGIGQELYFVIRQFIYADISAIVLLIIVTVIATDMICERIRTNLIAGGRQR